MKRCKVFISTMDEYSEQYKQETGKDFCTYKSGGKLLNHCNKKVDAFLRANSNIDVLGISHDSKDEIVSIVLVYDSKDI